MKIVFLDVDYVLSSILNAERLYKLTGKAKHGKNYPFDEVCLNNLKHLINDTNAYIVISSSWRKYDDHMMVLRDKLIEYGLFDRVIGMTDIIGEKYLEIKSFLRGVSCKFVILDDISDMGELNDYLVCTNPYYGLTCEDTFKAIKILKL